MWECLQTLTTLAANNVVQFCWVLGRQGIEGNEQAEFLAKKGAETPFFGSEPVCRISLRTIKAAIKQWSGEKLHAIVVKIS